MRKILLTLFILLGLSCSSSNNSEEIIVAIDNEAPETPIEKIATFEFIQYYMINERDGKLLVSNNNSKIFFDNSGTITNKTGGIYDTGNAPAVNTPYAFSELISDKVTYTENRIVIEKLSDDAELEIPVFKRTFILDENNNIRQKIIETSNPVEIDTLDFEYDMNGKISKIDYRNSTNSKESYYYFNTNDNLDSIVTTSYNQETDTSIKIHEKFEDYDSAENPVKDFFMFEEIFYRSLCKNNFSLYWYNTYTLSPSRSQSKSTYREWDFKYDSDGNIIFDER